MAFANTFLIVSTSKAHWFRVRFSANFMGCKPHKKSVSLA
jgi:hypothetical protein